ncbi:hypothetical protein V9T40_012886 [Parthenolecanium corni]|uniref:Uncharacterized protein n=1 Tax=Parthenolecanium corni TaxID=536013 RepID=A0AAN9Y0W6_9HEMI
MDICRPKDYTETLSAIRRMHQVPQEIFLVDVDALPKSRTGCGTAKRHTHTSAPKNTPVEGGIEGQHRALFPIPLIDDDQTKVAQSMRPSSSR